ncbi:unnamed protein product [Arctogadus glacialis]
MATSSLPDEIAQGGEPEMEVNRTCVRCKKKKNNDIRDREARGLQKTPRHRISERFFYLGRLHQKHRSPALIYNPALLLSVD